MSVFAAMFTMNNAVAEQYALLVGIADYHIKPLAGPKNDARLLKTILQTKWAFKPKNITLLLNDEGTRKNILDNIKHLYTKSKAGDSVFIYLSGHGTSSQDNAFKSNLPINSGAFIPVDIKSIKNQSELMQKLIIGRHDLKPLLQKFDNNGRHVFVAIDACFSGNTVRGLYNTQQLTTRYLSSNAILASRGLGENAAQIEKPRSLISSTENTIYPYKNIFYLSASSEYEPAQDIKPSMLARYPTIDGLPHGAFSDALLRVLNNTLNADSNNDGYINYSELKKSVRQFMRLRGFASTPQGLPSLAEDNNKLLSKAIFSHKKKNFQLKPKLNKIAYNKHSKQAGLNTVSGLQQKSYFDLNKTDLHINIDDSLTELRQRIKTIKNVRLVKRDAQLDIRKKNNSVLFISHAGDLILTLKNPSSSDIINAVNQQRWIKQLIDGQFKQDFTIDFDMFASGRGSTVVEGDTVGIAIKSSRAAYILILNINAQGTVTVLYPYNDAEKKPLRAYELLAFKALSKVVPPFGREYLQVYAFEQSSADYRDLMAKIFKPESLDAKKLSRLLQNAALKKARASLELVTSELN